MLFNSFKPEVNSITLEVCSLAALLFFIQVLFKIWQKDCPVKKRGEKFYIAAHSTKILVFTKFLSTVVVHCQKD